MGPACSQNYGLVARVGLVERLGSSKGFIGRSTKRQYEAGRSCTEEENQCGIPVVYGLYAVVARPWLFALQNSGI
jgi:hypothetical protein